MNAYVESRIRRLREQLDLCRRPYYAGAPFVRGWQYDALKRELQFWLEKTTPAGGHPAGSKPAPGKHAPHSPPPRDVRGLSGVPGEAGVSFSESEGLA